MEAGWLESSSRFEVVGELGAGGMGVVYEAFDHERGVAVALKTVHTDSRRRVELLKREFRAVADLTHPHLVSLYDLVANAQGCFFTMELVRGVDFLRHVCRPQLAPVDDGAAATKTANVPELTSTVVLATNRAGAPVRPPDVVMPFEARVRHDRLVAASSGLASALQALHDCDMIHRDLKPSNVLVEDGGRVVLLDFGILAQLGRTSARHGMVGTPSYMAPEQGDAASEPTPAADWYAFGVLLFRALAGRMPFYGPTFAHVVREKQLVDAPSPAIWTEAIPPKLLDLCEQLLSRDPAARPAGDEVLERLRGSAGSAAGRRPRTRSTRQPFVGRTAELARLDEALTASRRATRVALLRAASGMGKSALIAEVLARAATRDVPPLVLAGRCHERESIPYKGFDLIAAGLRNYLDQLEPTRRSALLPAGMSELVRLFPALAAGGDDRSADDANHGRLARRRRVAFAALRELLCRIAELSPVVIVVEDLHWADRETLALLERLLAPGAVEPPVLVLGSRRPDVTPLDGQIATALGKSVNVIDLAPLSADEQDALVEQLAGEAAASAGRALWGRAGGNPLFVGELVRYALERPTGDQTPPLTFELALAERLSRLSDDARAIAEVVLVAAEPTPAALIGRLASVAPADRERGIRELADHHVVRSVGRDGDIAPFHDRLRDAVLGDLAASRVTELHRSLALHLSSLERVGPERLARHWLAAGEPATAARHFAAAGDDAFGKLAFTAAADHYASALRHGDYDDTARCAIATQLADSFACGGHGLDAARGYDRAAALATGAVAADLRRLSAEYLLRSGHAEEGVRAFAAVLAERGEPIPASRARAIAQILGGRLRLALAKGLRVPPAGCPDGDALDRQDLMFSVSTTLSVVDPLRGAALHTRHLVDALRGGDPDRVVRALAIEVLLRRSEGSRSPALDHLAEELRLRARHSSELRVRAFIALSEGYAHIFDWRLRASQRSTRAAEELFSKCVGAEWERITCYYIHLACTGHMAEFGELDRRMRDYLDEDALARDAYARNVLSTEISAQWHMWADRPGDGFRRLARALDGWPTDVFTLGHYRASIAEIMLALYAGDGARAVDVARRLNVGMRKAMFFRVPVMAGHVGVWTVLAAAAANGPTRLLRAGIKLMKCMPVTAYRGIRELGFAALTARRGKGDASLAHLRRAVDLLDASEYALLAHCVRYRYGATVGGDDGRDAMATSVQALEREGTRDPVRLLGNVVRPLVPA